VAFAEGAAKEALFNGQTDASAYDSQNVVRDVLRPLRDAWPRHDIGAEVSYLDLKIRLAELLLMRIDKVTMSMGVEAREPFLDFHLVEYLMRLPLHLKVKRWSPKHLLKEAVSACVPENIRRRPKQAFAAPVNVWLRHGLGDFARHVIGQS